MEKLNIKYEGNLRNTIVHVRSNSEIITDAPVDNNGKGSYFSPTDLLAASLASCILTIIGIAAEKNGFSINGSTADIEKHMQSNPRKVEEIAVNLQLRSQEFDEKQRQIIERAAKNCPVALTLGENVKQRISFTYV